MKNYHFKCSSVVITILVTIALFLSTYSVYAETDITDLVQINNSRMLMDRLTSENYFNASLTNISEESLLAPITVVVDSISTAAVTVSNPDGFTEDGLPYYIYTVENDLLEASLSTESKTWRFANPQRARFTYTVSVYDSSIVFIDNDGDGVSPEQGDCDDENELIYPGADEICDGLDNNCDSQIDNGCYSEATMLVDTLGETLIAHNGATVILPTDSLDQETIISLKSFPEQQLIDGINTIGRLELFPSGTFFNKLLFCIMPLSQPRVPGSLLQIQILDEETGELTLHTLADGSVVHGVVSDDGLNVAFMTSHFSSYFASDLDSSWSQRIPSVGQEATSSIALYVPRSEVISQVIDGHAYDNLDALEWTNDSIEWLSEKLGFESFEDILPQDLFDGLDNVDVRQERYEEVIEALVMQHVNVHEINNIKGFLELAETAAEQFGEGSEVVYDIMDLSFRETYGKMFAHDLVYKNAFIDFFNNLKSSLQGLGIILESGEMAYKITEPFVYWVKNVAASEIIFQAAINKVKIIQNMQSFASDEYDSSELNYLFNDPAFNNALNNVIESLEWKNFNNNNEYLKLLVLSADEVVTNVDLISTLELSAFLTGTSSLLLPGMYSSPLFWAAFTLDEFASQKAAYDATLCRTLQTTIDKILFNIDSDFIEKSIRGEYSDIADIELETLYHLLGLKFSNSNLFLQSELATLSGENLSFFSKASVWMISQLKGVDGVPQFNQALDNNRTFYQSNLDSLVADYEQFSTFYPELTYEDLDGDGYINNILLPPEYYDCEDQIASVHPYAPEYCDGIDNQCEGFEGFGIIDEGCPANDSDGDSIPDINDNCLNVSNPDQLDFDSDGIGDLCDDDMDDDGILNADDAFPLNANETTDSDSDGVGDNSDCANTNSNIYVNAPELCDGIDNQCPGDIGYGEVDEGCSSIGVQLPTSYQILNLNEILADEVGATSTQILAINNLDQVLGYFETELGEWNTFIWDREDGIRDLGHVYGTVVNDNGEVAGYWLDNSNQRCFIWDDLTGFTDLGTLGASDGCSVNDLNNLGQITGYSSTGEVDSDGFRISHVFIGDRENGLLDIDNANNYRSSGHGINDNGIISGDYVTSRSNINFGHVFLWTPETGMYEYMSPMNSIYGMDINNSNIIVGTYVERALGWLGYYGYPYIWDSINGMTAFGSNFEKPISINENGLVHVYYSDSPNTPYHYIWDIENGATNYSYDTGFSIADINDQNIVLGAKDGACYIWNHISDPTLDAVEIATTCSPFAINNNNVIIGYSDDAFVAFPENNNQSEIDTPEILDVHFDNGACWMSVTWTDIGAETYEVYWGTEDAVTISSEMLPVTETTDYGHTGILWGPTYYYRVRGQFSDGTYTELSNTMSGVGGPCL